MTKKTLFLTIKKESFDKIKSGEKTEEERQCNPFYISRLLKLNEFVKYDSIMFVNGYRKDSPQIEIEHIKTDIYVYEDCQEDTAKDEDCYFIISLGKVIS